MPLLRKLFQGLITTLQKLFTLLFTQIKRLSGGKNPVTEFLKTKRSPIIWLWMGITYFLVLILTLLLIKIGFSGKNIAELAIENGQSVIVHTDKGTIEGKPYKNPAAKTAATAGGPETALQPAQGDEPPAEMLPTSKEGLAPMPGPNLTEKTDKGNLPVVGPDGTLPWKYYARPFTQKDKKPIVALIFTNMGLSKAQTEKVLTLQHDFTLAFSPYVSDVSKWALKARAEGFETLADLPMQAENYPLSDPGQFGLLEDLSPDQNIARLHSVLSRFPGYIGMMAPGDEKMTNNKDEIKPYLVELKKRGILFVYAKTSSNAALEDWARLNGFYTLGIDKIVDEDPARTAVDNQLQALTELAKNKGYAVGLIHSYPSTIEALQSWLDTLNAQGVELAPLSAVGNRVLP